MVQGLVSHKKRGGKEETSQSRPSPRWVSLQRDCGLLTICRGRLGLAFHDLFVKVTIYNTFS